MLTSAEISEANKFPIRKVGQKLAVGWEKAMLPTEGFFTLDQSELDGADVLAWNDEKPFNPAHAYELNDVSKYVKHVNLERGVEFPYAVQSAVADLQLVNHERMYSGAPYNYPARPLRLWGGLGKTTKNVELAGATEQQSYSGAQLLTKDGMATPSSDASFWDNFSAADVNSTPLSNGWARLEKIGTRFGNLWVEPTAIHGFATNSVYTIIVETANVHVAAGGGAAYLAIIQPAQTQDSFTSPSVIVGGSGSSTATVETNFSAGAETTVVVATTKSAFGGAGLRTFISSTTPIGTKVDVRVTILAGDHSADWQDYAGENWQPYVGGIPAPNPDYPQPIRTATGVQTVNVNGVDYDVNLGDIELCKIGDHQDRIYYENGKWWLRKENYCYVFDGGSGDNWYVSGQCYKSNLGSTRPEISGGYDFRHYGTIGLYSNYGKEAPARELYLESSVAKIGLAAIDTGGGYSSVYVSKGSFATVNDFRAFLQTSPLVVYAVLATPITTEITEASLLAGLNAVRDAAIKSGTDNATAQGDLPAEVTITTTSDGTMTLMPLFEGFTTDTPNYAGRDEREMSLNAMDSLYEICNQDLPNMFMATNLRTDEVIRQILVDELGIGDYLLDFEEGDVVIPFVWFEAGKDVGNALKDVVQVENGRLWVDETGKIRFSKHGLNELTTPAVEHFDSSNIISVTTLLADRLINECRIECGIREVQSRQMVYSEENESGYSQTADNDPYRIASSATSTFWVQLEDPCASVDTPLIRTARSDVASYFVAVRVSDGVAQASGLSISDFVAFGDRVMLKITNSNNYALSIREIKFWGMPARVVQTVNYTAKDNDSIKAYGRRALEIDSNELWGSAENIRDYARKVVQMGADFSQNLEMEVRSNLLLQVGDVVTVRLDDWTEGRRFAIESVTITIDSPENCAIKQTLKLVATAEEE